MLFAGPWFINCQLSSQLLLRPITPTLMSHLDTLLAHCLSFRKVLFINCQLFIQLLRLLSAAHPH
jgi:hypothetical protein